MMQHMLTTIDNPYDPFTQYTEWEQFDEDAGYYTSQYLARIALGSHELSDSDQELIVETAINEIVKENVLGIYKKVSKPFTIPEVSD